MKQFITVSDVPNIHHLIDRIAHFKQQKTTESSGKGRSVGLFFFNPSLRTRLSTQRAAQKLGMDVISNNMADGWPLEFEKGAIMNASKSEHIAEAAAVIAQYFDIIGIRAFPGLKNMAADYSNPILTTFQQYIDKPILNLESGSAHPCQGLTDVFTIEEHKPVAQPKVVLSWAPHPKALPHSVANSFLRFCNAMQYDLHVVNPAGYDLPITKELNIQQHRDQHAAFDGAHFVYAKNWSASEPYGSIQAQSRDWIINGQKMDYTDRGRFMHCLPVRRNVVVADEVLDHKNALIIEQAQNRMWAAMAILEALNDGTM